MFESTFKAIGDPSRKKILELLRDGKKMTAGEIASNFDMSFATISYHLSLLKIADLIREEKDKNFIYYELNTSIFDEMIIWLNSFGGSHEKE